MLRNRWPAALWHRSSFDVRPLGFARGKAGLGSGSNNCARRGCACDARYGDGWPGGRGGSRRHRSMVGQDQDADQRADELIKVMTLDEKIQLLHGGPGGMGGARPLCPWGLPHGPMAARVGFPGIARLGIPDVNMADSAVGVTRGESESRYSTLLPSALGARRPGTPTWRCSTAR